ncbi:MAG: ATPase domain-containing protein [Thermoproteota archaeon]
MERAPRLIGGVVQLSALSTGNEELDEKLGGGIPIPSMLLVEGDNGSGKSVLAHQVAYGALKSGLRVYYVTTEATVKELILQMENLSFNVKKFFLRGSLRLYSAYVRGMEWKPEAGKRALASFIGFMQRTADAWDMFVVDSLTMLLTYAEPAEVFALVSQGRRLVSRGKVLLMTLHRGVLPEDVVSRLRSLCDGYIVLSQGVIGGRLVKTMKVVKLRGAKGFVEGSIAYEVDPAFGIKVLPLSVAGA